MRGTLTLNRLRYFLAIAEHGSISGASRALNLAQPALSYHVAELERLTGLTLLVRNRDGVALTDAGETLRRHASDIVGRTDAAETALAALARRSAPVPRVRIAVITSLAAALTPRMVESVARDSDPISLSIIEAGTRDIELRLGRGEIDMAVYLEGSPGTDAMPVAREQLWFLSQARGSDDAGEISLSALSAYPLVLPAKSNPLRAFLDKAFASRKLALDVVLEVDGLAPRFNAVANGIGSTILGAHAIPERLADGLRARRIVEPELFRPIYLGYRRGFDQTLADRMAAIVTDTLRALGLHGIDRSAKD